MPSYIRVIKMLIVISVQARCCVMQLTDVPAASVGIVIQGVLYDS
jgi:hypothetical protein